MASFTFNAGSYALQHQNADYLADTIKVMLLGTATPYTPNKDEASMTTPALSELAVSGYAGGFSGAGRQTLASKTLTNDTTNDRTVYDAADPSAWTLGAGDSVAAAIVYWHSVDDATSVPLFYLDFADVPTNGGAFALSFDAAGIAYTQQ
jgi:hypothetical protein